MVIVLKASSRNVEIRSSGGHTKTIRGPIRDPATKTKGRDARNTSHAIQSEIQWATYVSRAGPLFSFVSFTHNWTNTVLSSTPCCLSWHRQMNRTVQHSTDLLRAYSGHPLVSPPPPRAVGTEPRTRKTLATYCYCIALGYDISDFSPLHP